MRHDGSMQGCCSIVEILRRRTIQETERIAYRFLSDREPGVSALTYGQLGIRAMAVGSWLMEKGLTAEPVALILPPGLDYVVAFFGVLCAGAIAVPLNPPGSRNFTTRTESALGDVKCRLALTTSRLLPKIARMVQQNPCLSSIEFATIESIPDTCASEWHDPGITSEAPAIIQYTSGSTSDPKGVLLRNRNLLHNVEMMTRVSELDRFSVGVSWLPHYHDMGLVAGTLMPAYAGFPVTLLSPVTFLAQPIRWLEAISTDCATVSGGPNFAYEHCIRNIRQHDITNIDLSTWRVAYCGGEPVRPYTLDRFLAKFGRCGFREQTFFPCYGLAEATLMVSGGPVDAPPASEWISGDFRYGSLVRTPPHTHESTRILASGALIADNEVVIVDPEAATRCEDSQIGEIWIAGGSVGDQYWHRPEETKETFGARLADTGAGPFLRTGDLGFIQDGMLFVAGRCKDLIIIRGANYYPQDIEETVEKSHQALRAGCGAAFSIDSSGDEKLVIVYEIDRRVAESQHDSIIRAIVQSVADRHGLQVYAIALIKQGTVFKTTSGKVQRRQNRSAFMSSTLTVVREWRIQPSDVDPASGTTMVENLAGSKPADEMQVEALLISEMAKMLGIDPTQIDPMQSIYALGLDSLMVANLRNRLMSTLNIEIELAELMKHSTIKDTVSYVAIRIGKI